MAKSKRKKGGRKGRLPHPKGSKSGGGSKLQQLQQRADENPGDIDAQLTLAEGYLSCDRSGEAVPALESVAGQYPFSNRDDSRRYLRARSLAHLAVKDYGEAEKAALAGLDEYPEVPSFKYVLCLVQGALREHEQAIETGRQYLEQSVGADDKGDRARVLQVMGNALWQTGKAAEATECFRDAIDCLPKDQTPYLELAKLYRQGGQHQEADRIIKAGLRTCRQVQELRLLQAAFSQTVTVSACMMVKNEEDLLGNCLDSIRDWVDEIIVVDTGSTDRTVEIAQSYGAKIYHQAWEDDFSKHRNYSIEQARSDWVFIIDADEVICTEDVEELFKYLEDERVQAVSVNVINVYGDREQQQIFLPSPRLFRRELNGRYEGIVHNRLYLPDDIGVIRTGVRLKHYGYDLSPEKMAQKVQRSRQLLEKQLEENPENAFAMFNLAQLLRKGSDERPDELGPEILRLAGRAVELTGPDKKGERHIHLMSLDQLAWTHFYMKDFSKALEYCAEALKYKSDYLDPKLLLGHIYGGMGDYDKAIVHYQQYLEAQAAYDPNRETDEIILQHIDSRAAVYCNLGLIEYSRQNWETSRSWFGKALDLDPEHPGANGWLGRVSLQLNMPDKAESHLLAELATGELVTDEPRLLGELYLSRGQMEEAEKYFLEAHRLTPEDISILLKLGLLMSDTDRSEAASKYYSQAIELAGNDLSLGQQVAEVFQQVGRVDEAIAMYEKLATNGLANGHLLNDLGNCYYRMERFDEAQEYYVQALTFETPPPAAYRNLGLTEARLNLPREAAERLRQYLELQPDDGEILKVLGDLSLQLEEYQSALGYYERFLRQNPVDKLATFSLAECYLAMGHRDSAIMGYQRVLQLDDSFGPAQSRLERLSTAVDQF